MDLPTRITPDSIREAIVEVKYQSLFPHELLLGIFFQAFGDDYTYTDRPVKSPVVIPANLNQPPQLNIQIGKQSLLYNKKISVQFLPQSFVFTCLNQYIGWGDYQPEIEKALRTVYSTGKIKIFSRVGLRYITEYMSVDLRNITKFEFKFGMPEIDSEAIAFKSEFMYASKKVILNLHNKLPYFAMLPGTHESKREELSRIDIDVIQDLVKIESIDKLLQTVDEVHNIEKQIFFGMLKDDFLKTLNPEY